MSSPWAWLCLVCRLSLNRIHIELHDTHANAYRPALKRLFAPVILDRQENKKHHTPHLPCKKARDTQTSPTATLIPISLWMCLNKAWVLNMQMHRLQTSCVSCSQGCCRWLQKWMNLLCLSVGTDINIAYVWHPRPNRKYLLVGYNRTPTLGYGKIIQFNSIQFSYNRVIYNTIVNHRQS